MKFHYSIYFYTFFILSIVYPQYISIIPEIQYKFTSDSEDYFFQNMKMYDYELKINGKYKFEKINILVSLGYHLLDGTGISNSKPIGLSDFTRSKGLYWTESPPGIARDQSNYYVSDMKLEYGDSVNYFYINKWNKKWGPGINSLTISDKMPNIFYFGFKWKLKNNIYFEYFHGKLKSGISNSDYLEHYNNIGTRNFDINRNIVGHRIDWYPNKKIIISASELVVYANRSIEMTYLLPFVPFFSLQNYLGDIDNVIMNFDIKYRFSKSLDLYTSFLMDEWSPPYTFDIDNHNWFGWQVGLALNKQFNQFRFEYTWTDHRIYRHRFPVNDFYSWGYPIGFWAGPHAQELYIDYNMKFGRNHIKIIFSDAKRGELTSIMLEDQYNRPNDQPVYKRFSNIYEKKVLYNVSFYRYIKENIKVNILFFWVDWKNAGFNPYNQSNDNVNNIQKKSISLEVNYIF